MSKSCSCNKSDFQRKPLFLFQVGSTERKTKHRYTLVHPQCVELPRSSSVVTFLSQSCLPPIATNQFSFEWTTPITDDFVLVRSSHVAKALSKMNIDSGTGPDGLSTRVLILCSRELGLPLAKLIRRIIAERLWPAAWKIHGLMALCSKKRGFQL